MKNNLLKRKQQIGWAVAQSLSLFNFLLFLHVESGTMDVRRLQLTIICFIVFVFVNSKMYRIENTKSFFQSDLWANAPIHQFWGNTIIGMIKKKNTNDGIIQIKHIRIVAPPTGYNKCCTFLNSVNHLIKCTECICVYLWCYFSKCLSQNITKMTNVKSNAILLSAKTCLKFCSISELNVNFNHIYVCHAQMFILTHFMKKEARAADVAPTKWCLTAVLRG